MYYSCLKKFTLDQFYNFNVIQTTCVIIIIPADVRIVSSTVIIIILQSPVTCN